MPGTLFIVTAPSGAGKTTLISALAGLVLPDSGRLEVMGHDVQTDYAQARRLLTDDEINVIANDVRTKPLAEVGRHVMPLIHHALLLQDR